METQSLFVFFAVMGYAEAYLRTAAELISTYKGEEPFAARLKKYFSQHRKYGSRDRKMIAQLCYSYFRLGKSFPQLNIEEKIIAALFLCSENSHVLLQQLRPHWNEMASFDLPEKMKVLEKDLQSLQPFPFPELVSDAIDRELFSLSHLRQPDLFLRIRPGRENAVKQKLTQAGVVFQEPFMGCLSLPNITPVHNIIMLNREAVVQDMSSQRTAALLASISNKNASSLHIWDCCAASGGKSIMLYDMIPEAQLTVSDIRNSILSNLRERFAEAGIKNYDAFQADLSAKPSLPPGAPFDLVVADVPCSGSGTWGRTPEYLQFFQVEEVARYSALQRNIIRNVVPQLKKGGYLLYITCSVFKEENEINVEWICAELGLKSIEQQLIKGYAQRADTMFAALLTVS